MQHRKILFLISLPETEGFQRDKKDLDNCVSELRMNDAEVSCSLSREILGSICQYDAVTIIAHYDNESDSLILKDRSMPVSEFVDSLPVGFCGVLDLSVCHSVNIIRAIKERCPLCRIQATLSQVPLLSRLLIYPQVAKRFLSSGQGDYASAYNEVSAMFNSLLMEMGPTASPAYPYMTHLGQSISSVYAPETVMRNVPFIIAVYFSYNAQDQTVTLMQTDAVERCRIVKQVKLDDGDEVDVSLAFFSSQKRLIRIQGDKRDHKSLAVGKDTATASFIVNVSDRFGLEGFVTRATISSGSATIAELDFNINVGARQCSTPAKVSVRGQSADPPAITLERYRTITAIRLLNNEVCNDILGSMNSRLSDEARLNAVRARMFKEQFFLTTISTKIQKALNEIKELQQSHGRTATISIDILQPLKKHLDKACETLTKIQMDFLAMDRSSDSGCLESTAFLKLEDRFLAFAKTLLHLLHQIPLLKDLIEIQRQIQKTSPDIADIEDKATELMKWLKIDHVDEELFSIINRNNRSTDIWHPRWGVPQGILALLLAMMQKEDKVIIRRSSKMVIKPDLSRYMEIGTRSSVSRIYDIFKNLDDSTIRDAIRKYQSSESVKFSVSAYYIQKIIIRML